MADKTVTERPSVHSSAHLSPSSLFQKSFGFPWNWCKPSIPNVYPYSALFPNLRNGTCLSEELVMETVQAPLFTAPEMLYRTTANSSVLAMHSSGEVARNKRVFHYDLVLHWQKVASHSRTHSCLPCCLPERVNTMKRFSINWNFS